MVKHNGMRPQDIMVLLKMVDYGNQEWQNVDLAKSLDLSQAEVSNVLERCRIARLVNDNKRRVNTVSLLEFLQHGLPFVFPAITSAPKRGVLTGVSSEPMASLIVSDKDKFVWPFPKGNARGISVSPLYSTVPEVSQRDPGMHELLSLVDCLRMGKVREKEIATKLLSEKFQIYNHD